MAYPRYTIAEKLAARSEWRGECLEWTGTRIASGYGQLRHDGKRGLYVHRLAYAEAFGPIPPGFHIHHECENRACINPAHLRAVTPAEHRDIHRITQCVRGHEMTPENTRVDRSGRRHCRACATEWSRKQAAQAKAARHATPGFKPRKEAA